MSKRKTKRYLVFNSSLKYHHYGLQPRRFACEWMGGGCVWCEAYYVAMCVVSSDGKTLLRQSLHPPRNLRVLRRHGLCNFRIMRVCMCVCVSVVQEHERVSLLQSAPIMSV